MSDQKEVILKLSHAIASRFSIFKWIAAVSALVSLAVLYYAHLVSVVHSFFAGIFALSVLQFIYWFNHGRTMLHFLRENNDSALPRLETYLENKQERWEKYYWWRVMLVAIYGLIMLFTLIFFKDSRWSPRIAGLFPILVLAFILRGWSQFNDKILLHDVTRNKNH